MHLFLLAIQLDKLHHVFDDGSNQENCEEECAWVEVDGEESCISALVESINEFYSCQDDINNLKELLNVKDIKIKEIAEVEFKEANHKIKLLVLIVAINRLKKIPVLYPDIPNTKDYIKTTNVPIAFTDTDIIISKKQNSNSQTNILGVRPEKMFLSDKKGIPGEIFGSEYLGTRKILTIQSQFGTYKVRVSNDVNLKIGSNVKINFESESAIIFDNQTDKALLSDFIN